MKELWQQKRLKFIAPSSKKILPARPIGTRYIGLENIESGTGKMLLDAEQEHVDSSVVVFNNHSVLFGKLRPYLAKVAIPDFSGVASTEIMVLEPKQSNDRRFLYYSLLDDEFIKRVSGMADGAKMPRANPDDIVNQRLYTPANTVQAKTANYLDKAIVKIDQLLTLRHRHIELLKEQRDALILQAVTRGLNPKVQMKKTGLPWMGKLPKHWKMVRVKYVARLESGHTPSRQHPEWWENCTIPWVSLSDVGQFREGQIDHITNTTENVSEIGLANSSARLLPAGTVLVSRTASVGYSVVAGVPLATTQDFVNWICGKNILPEYLLYVFRIMQPEFKRLKSGSTHQTIYMPDVANFVTPLPPIEEQHIIYNQIKKINPQFDILISAYKRQILLLKDYRSSLIHECVTGQKTISQK